VSLPGLDIHVANEGHEDIALPISFCFRETRVSDSEVDKPVLSPSSEGHVDRTLQSERVPERMGLASAKSMFHLRLHEARLTRNRTGCEVLTSTAFPVNKL
jgi:hypothetical protein